MKEKTLKARLKWAERYRNDLKKMKKTEKEEKELEYGRRKWFNHEIDAITEKIKETEKKLKQLR